MKEKYIVIILPSGIEVIGKIQTMTDHTITLLNSCILPDSENLVLIGDYVIYSKNDKVTYNRDMLVGEYEPSDKAVELYSTLLEHDAYKMTKELVEETIQTEISSMAIHDETVMERLQETGKRLDKLTGPKVMEVKDVLAQIQEKVKKKLN